MGPQPWLAWLIKALSPRLPGLVLRNLAEIQARSVTSTLAHHSLKVPMKWW
jgi:hypothetical protein